MLYVPIWTTTPWTIPANRAIAYGKELDYILIIELKITMKTNKLRLGKKF